MVTPTQQGMPLLIKRFQRRAQAVVDYLVSKGVDASKLVAKGHGSEQPVADNTTEEGRFKTVVLSFQ